MDILDTYLVIMYGQKSWYRYSMTRFSIHTARLSSLRELATYLGPKDS
jgi:hypothetical protein